MSQIDPQTQPNNIDQDSDDEDRMEKVPDSKELSWSSDEDGDTKNTPSTADMASPDNMPKRQRLETRLERGSDEAFREFKKRDTNLPAKGTRTRKETTIMKVQKPTKQRRDTTMTISKNDDSVDPFGDDDDDSEFRKGGQADGSDDSDEMIRPEGENVFGDSESEDEEEIGPSGKKRSIFQKNMDATN